MDRLLFVSVWLLDSDIRLLVAAGDEEKAGLLRRLVPGAAERLRLFDADLFDAATFAPAIAGCQFVFLVATPFGLQDAGSKVKVRHRSRFHCYSKSHGQAPCCYLFFSCGKLLSFQSKNLRLKR